MQVSDVIEEFGQKVKYILDGGQCKIGIESTIINLIEINQQYLRLGGLEISKIEKVLIKKLK